MTPIPDTPDTQGVPTAWSGMLGDGHDYSRTGKHDPLNCRRCLQQANRALAASSSPREPQKDETPSMQHAAASSSEPCEGRGHWNGRDFVFSASLCPDCTPEPREPHAALIAERLAKVLAEIRESATRNDDNAVAAEKVEKNEEGYQVGHTAGWERGVAFGKYITCQRIEAALKGA